MKKDKILNNLERLESLKSKDLLIRCNKIKGFENLTVRDQRIVAKKNSLYSNYYRRVLEHFYLFKLCEFINESNLGRIQSDFIKKKIIKDMQVNVDISFSWVLLTNIFFVSFVDSCYLFSEKYSKDDSPPDWVSSLLGTEKGESKVLLATTFTNEYEPKVNKILTGIRGIGATYDIIKNRHTLNKKMIRDKLPFSILDIKLALGGKWSLALFDLPEDRYEEITTFQKSSLVPLSAEAQKLLEKYSSNYIINNKSHIEKGVSRNKDLLALQLPSYKELSKRIKAILTSE